MFGRTPLAWKNLTHDRRRLAIAAGGIGFAVLLMTTQLGFLHAMSDSNVEVLERLNADLVLRNASRYTLAERKGFARRRLGEAAAVPGVVAAEPLYLEQNISQWRSKDDGADRSIRVLAFNLDGAALDLPEMAQLREPLRRPLTAASDLRSKRGYGNLETGTTSELTGKRIEIVGRFALGTDFINDGNLLMSDQNFARYFPARNPRGDTLDEVDLGVIRIAPGEDPYEVAERIGKALDVVDVEILTKADMISAERSFWRDSTPIGFVFGLGTLMGFIVGVIICYQVLYSDIADHMSEFATLKAIGYRTRYFVGVVMQESVLLSLFGFLPGILFSMLLFLGLGEWTGLLMRLTPWRAVAVLSLTIAMCVASGFFAMRKLIAADPAELFR